MKLVKVVCLSVLCSLIFSLNAEEKNECDNFESEPAYFKELYKESASLGLKICGSLGYTMDLDSLVSEYAKFADTIDQTITQSFAGFSFYNELKAQVEHFKTKAQFGVDKGSLPYFDFRKVTSSFDKYSFNFQSWNTKGFVDTSAAECQKVPSCEDLFKSLEVAINQYKEPYVRLSAEHTTKKVKVLRKEWDTYFEEARSQTLWDAAITTYMEEDYLTQDKLVGPMQRQWFLVHPSLVVENVSDALDGSETQQGLAVEWVGVNWWNSETSPIGVPFGISLASIYSNRPDVDDAGHGVMMTFNNSLSVGWADHGGDDGVYVSVDFLSFLTERKKRWGKFKEDIKRFEFD